MKKTITLRSSKTKKPLKKFIVLSSDKSMEFNTNMDKLRITDHTNKTAVDLSLNEWNALRKELNYLHSL